jgi:photosystem II stability/assembly factor-like uncharacterized protein
MKQSKKLLCAALFVCGSFLEAGAQVAWTMRNPSPALKTVQGITWTGTLAVAVGDSGSIATSPNGSLWTVRNGGASTNFALTSVAHGGGNMVALGVGGIIRRSTDGGLTWAPVTAVTPASTATINAVAYCGDKFVAVGASGTILTSTDGSSWTSQALSPLTSTIWRSIAWNGTFAVAVGDGGVLATTVNGSTWTTAAWTGITGTTGAAMYSIQWANGKFIVGGAAGEIRTSSGSTPGTLQWTKQISNFPSTAFVSAIVWTGSLFVAVGSGGNTVTSTDGAAWTTAVVTAATDVLRAITWTSTRFLVAGNITPGNIGLIKASTTGTSWTSAALTTVNLWGAAWATGKPRVVVGDAGNTLVSTSDTGWVMKPTGGAQGLYGVTWAGNQVVAVGGSGAVFTSADGDVWALRPVANVVELLNSVAYNGTGSMVAVGGSARIISSTNGTDWTIRTATGVPGTTTLYSVAWCGNKFVAVGGGGTILTSNATGTTWSVSSVGTSPTATYRAVAYTGNQIVVAGASGVILTSPDGSAWTTRASGVSATFNSVAWNGTALVAIGSSGTVLTSVDEGVSWNAQLSATGVALNAVTPTESGWASVGVGGALQTAPSIPLPGIPNPTAPANAATGQAVYGPFVWDAVSGALSYRLQVATDSNFVGLVVNDTMAVTTKSVPALNSNTLYYWHVRAQNLLGGGTYSVTRRFTTGLAPTSPPAIPVLLTPPIFDTTITLPATLVWNTSNGAESYFVQVSTSPTFANFALQDSTVTALSRVLGSGTLSAGLDYYWRVRAKNGFGSSDWSATWTFKTVLAVPGKPALVLPAQFATGVDRAPQLKWDSVSTAVKYHVQVGRDGGFTVLVASDSTTATTWMPPAIFAASTDHYWRVRARNNAGWGEYSDIRRFQTGLVSAVLPGQRMSRFFRAGEGQYLRFSMSRADRVQIRLYDMQGRLAAGVLNELRSAGEHTVTLPAGLAESLYMLEFRVGTKREWLTVHP